MEQQIERVADLIDFENKSAQDIIDIFECILEKVFTDKNYSRARFLVVEKFASCIVDRATHLDSDRLLAALSYRIHLIRFHANIC